MASGMVEKVAKAIHEADSLAGHCDGQTSWRSYVPNACAAIEAMREPNEAMIAAHTNRSRSSIVGTGSHFTDEALNAWRSMIDAALKER